MKPPRRELVPMVQQLIELLPLTWFPNLVHLLPLEQLEISSTDRLGLQRAAQEDGQRWWSSGAPVQNLCPPIPSPARGALWGRGVGTARWAGCQGLPAVGSVRFGAGEVAARSSDPPHLPSSASSSWALLRAPQPLQTPSQGVLGIPFPFLCLRELRKPPEPEVRKEEMSGCQGSLLSSLCVCELQHEFSQRLLDVVFPQGSCSVQHLRVPQSSGCAEEGEPCILQRGGTQE